MVVQNKEALHATKMMIGGVSLAFGRGGCGVELELRLSWSKANCLKLNEALSGVI